MTVEFLTLEAVIEIHALQVERFGGASGVRDSSLLASAIAQPSATFGGKLLHVGLVEMAAAYLFHLASNHPFVDGNKRVGLASALVFLDLNGLPIRWGTSALYELTMAVARGELSKAHVALRLREILENPETL